MNKADTLPFDPKLPAAYAEFLQSSRGGKCVAAKVVGEGIYAAVKPLLFHWTLLTGMIGDEHEWAENWCYQTREGAEKALSEWTGEGEPEGWFRHPRTWRRRPDGDPSREYEER